MGIRILIGDKNNVDLGSKIDMSSEEYNKFISLMKSLFNPIEIDEPVEFRHWRIAEEGRIQYPHSWTAKEYEVLLNCSLIDEAVNKLGRSGMAVIIQSGEWEERYFNWCEEKNKDWNNVENIKQFMKECDDLIKLNKEKRTAKAKIEKFEKDLIKINDIIKRGDIDKKDKQDLFLLQQRRKEIIFALNEEGDDEAIERIDKVINELKEKPKKRRDELIAKIKILKNFLENTIKDSGFHEGDELEAEAKKGEIRLRRK